MRIGVDYYPEQCEPSCWPRDIELMTEAGVSLVRMAEFAWSRLEPEHGRYEVGWLDRILEMFHVSGIHVVLGTPTAAPPAWLHAMHPDVYPADNRRYRLGFGTREQRCLNNDRMRAHSRRIVEVLAQRFGGHPAVIGWQTDNELSGNLCYCPVCAQKFRAWLREKYGSLEALNQAWGTSFWSQEYSDWEQIPLPWRAKCGDQHNPSLQFEFRRFQSNASVEFQREQAGILREYAPHHFITHNMMGTHSSVDYYALGQDLDFVSWDNYPITPWRQTPFGAALAADVMRGIKQRNVWVMEQQNGITGWEHMGRRPSGAWLRCAAWQTVAHGADAVVFFRWDSARHGTEQFWHGIVSHDRVPRRRYRELVEFSQEARELTGALEGTETRSEVAILNSYEQHFAFDIQPQADGLAVWDQVGRYYRALRGSGLNVDIVPITCDLSRYKFVVAPSWYIMTENDAGRLVEYVLNGGTLALSPRTGVKNGVNACRAEPLPSLLREAAGIEVDDYDPLGKDETIVRTTSGSTHAVTVWADALSLLGAEPVAHYAGVVYAGEPAIARNRFGEGAVYYFGTFGEPALYQEVFGQILDEVGVRDRIETPEGVDAAWREDEHARYLFLINFNDTGRTVAIPDGMTRLLGGATKDGAITLPALGVAIYQGDPSPGRDENGAELERRAVAATL